MAGHFFILLAPPGEKPLKIMQRRMAKEPGGKLKLNLKKKFKESKNRK